MGEEKGEEEMEETTISTSPLTDDGIASLPHSIHVNVRSGIALPVHEGSIHTHVIVLAGIETRESRHNSLFPDLLRGRHSASLTYCLKHFNLLTDLFFQLLFSLHQLLHTVRHDYRGYASRL